jgi:hypothetical protein
MEMFDNQDTGNISFSDKSAIIKPQREKKCEIFKVKLSPFPIFS